MERVKAAFVEYEVSKRKKETIVTHAKLRKVLDTWIGNSIETLFFGWKDYIRAKKKVKQNFDGVDIEKKQRSKQEEEELMKLAKLEVNFTMKIDTLSHVILLLLNTNALFQKVEFMAKDLGCF